MEASTSGVSRRVHLILPATLLRYARSPEVLAAVIVMVLVPIAVVVGVGVGLDRLARFSFGVVGVSVAVGAPTALGLLWAAAAGLAEVSIGDQTIAGYLSGASLLPFLVLIGFYVRAGPRFDHPISVWILFVALTMVTWPMSPLSRADLIQKLVGLLDYLGLGLLVAGLAPRRKAVLAAAICIAIAAHGVLGVLQYLGRFDGFDAGDGIYRVAGAFGWSSTLGYLLAVGLPLAFALTLGTTGIGRLLPAGCAGAIAIGLALTFSRTSLVAGAAGCVLVALSVGGLPGRGLAGLAAGAAALVALAPTVGVDITSRFLYGDSVLEFATLNGRTIAWDALLSQGLTPFGHGLFAARDLLDQLVSGPIAPHNVYLESLYDFGVVGAVVLIWLHVALFWKLGQLARRPEPERYLALGAIGAVFASLLHGLTGSELWHFSVGVYFFLIAFLPLSAAGLPSAAVQLEALGGRLSAWTRRPA